MESMGWDWLKDLNELVSIRFVDKIDNRKMECAKEKISTHIWSEWNGMASISLIDPKLTDNDV